MGNYRGFRKINHSGSFGGYNSYVYMLPDLKIGAFVAVNGGSDVYNFMRKVIYAAFDMLLGVNQGYLKEKIRPNVINSNKKQNFILIY